MKRRIIIFTLMAAFALLNIIIVYGAEWESTEGGNGPKTVKLFTSNKLGDKPDGSNTITLPSSGSKTKSLSIAARKSKYVKIIHPSGASSHENK